MRRIRLNVGESSFEVTHGDTLVGRAPECHVRLSEASVSRLHVLIKVTSDTATIEDLASTNGTRLNGELLTGRTPLTDGDLLEIGDCSLSITIDDAMNTGPHRPLRKKTRDTLIIPNAAINAWAERNTDAAQALIRRDTQPGWGAEQSSGANARGGLVPRDTQPGRYIGGKSSEATTDLMVRNMDPRERRRHARMNAGTRVRYDSESLKFEAIAQDVSDGGVFVVTELLDQVGTSCQMTVELEGIRPFSAIGVVRHVVANAALDDARPPGMGIEFLELQGFGRPS